MKTMTLAKIERKVRPLLSNLPFPRLSVKLYSRGRRIFLHKLNQEEVPRYTLPKELERTLWGIRFRSPLMNAAGMFKNGECFDIVDRQGAGAYEGGTGTWNQRDGNTKEEVYLPFIPYARSHTASNVLGLPNDGDEKNASRAGGLRGKSDCPVVWSVMGSPDYQGEEKNVKLVKGLHKYALAGVDVLELNESCPNISHSRPQDDDLTHRLEYTREHFLKRRLRKFPTVVKFSCDTPLAQVPYLLDLLIENGYDGVNFGNTSTDYERCMNSIEVSERKMFRYFTGTFKGGVSGKPLREVSLALAAKAVEYLRAGPPPQKFHVIRTGGIECAQDIIESDQAGVSLNQFFTGYFENFSVHGHRLYEHIYSEYLALKK